MNVLFRTEPITIHLKLSKPAPESIFSIDKDGGQIVLLWDHKKEQVALVISNEIPSKIYEYIKFLIDKIHEHYIKVNGYFHIGTYYTIVRSPYIYKFRLIEKIDDEKKKYPIVQTSNYENLNKTVVIKRTILVSKNNDTPSYVHQIADSLYYAEHLDILSEYIINDLVGVISNYLYSL